MTTITDPIEQDDKNVHQFWYYMATYPNAVVIFQASGMSFCADTDASYLTEPQALSCAAGYFFLGSITSKYARERLNVPILVNCNILKKLLILNQKHKPGGVSL